MNWHEAWNMSPAEYQAMQERGRIASEIQREARERMAERERQMLERKLDRMRAGRGECAGS